MEKGAREEGRASYDKTGLAKARKSSLYIHTHTRRTSGGRAAQTLESRSKRRLGVDCSSDISGRCGQSAAALILLQILLMLQQQ